MRRLLGFLFACVALAQVAAGAQEPTQTAAPPPLPAVDADGVRNLDTMVVTGVQPGPGLWKVSKGGHSMWILGTVTPLPNDIEWLSRDVDAVLDQSGAVLGPPGLNVTAKIGLFKGLTLLPSAMKAAKNPDGERLQDVLPPDLYARWSVLKARYLGRDAGVEKKRPMVAAAELYQQALRKSGLGRKPVVTPVIEAGLKRRKLKQTPTVLEYVVDDPKGMLQDIRATRFEDTECFRATLQRIERDLPLMVERANAWSIGDLDALARMPFEDQQAACMVAATDNAVARKHGLTDLPRRSEDRWFTVARAAIDAHAVSFATMPVTALTRPNGYLDRLRAEGYEVEAP